MIFKTLASFFKGKRLLATFLVLVGTAGMIRLGFWQLDRLQQRREFNAQVIKQTNELPLELNNVLQNQSLPDTNLLTTMEYRKIDVVGEYDYKFEVALRNQVYRDQYGVHLLTPLKIRGTESWILVDRGWIPGSDFDSGKVTGEWPQFEENGMVEISGIIREAQTKPDFGNIADPTPIAGGDRISAWNFANIPQMQKQIPYPLLPVYVQQAPDPDWKTLPYRSEPNLEITEGPHQGYAIQWFTFATILFFGYPVMLYREDHNRNKNNNVRENTNRFSGEHTNG